MVRLNPVRVFNIVAVVTLLIVLSSSLHSFDLGQDPTPFLGYGVIVASFWCAVHLIRHYGLDCRRWFLGE